MRSKKKRKVLVVYPYFATYRSAVIAELIASESFDYRFAAGAAAKAPGLKVLQDEAFPKGAFLLLRNIWVKKVFLWQRELCRLLSREKYDVVIFLGDAQYLSSWIGALIARIRGKTVVMWTHGVRRFERGIKGRIRFLFYRLAHGLMVYGNRGKELLVRGGRDPSEIAVIFNSLDYKLQKRLREASRSRGRLRRDLNLPDETMVLIWVGRVVRGRNLDLLFKAVAFLAPRQPLRILLVGEGPEMKVFQEQAKVLGIAREVCWLGAIHDEESLASLFCASDACVCPGPVGLLAMHAMAYGIPVVTHDDFNSQKPEVEAIIPGKTGAFFRAGDCADFVRKIKEVVALSRNGVAEKACIEAVERNYTATRQRDLIEAALREWGK